MTSALATHTLGSLDLTDGTKFEVLDTSGWEPEDLDQYVPLRATDGVVLAYARRGRMVRPLHMRCKGSDYEDAEANHQSVEAVLEDARNGVEVLYVIQEASQGSADTWKVKGGRWLRSDELILAGLVSGIARLVLSKA